MIPANGIAGHYFLSECRAVFLHAREQWGVTHISLWLRSPDVNYKLRWWLSKAILLHFYPGQPTLLALDESQPPCVGMAQSTLDVVPQPLLSLAI